MSRRALINMVGVAGLVLAVGLPFESSRGWIDPVTGSMKSQRRIFLIPVSTVVKTSAVERWVVRTEGGYTNRWKFLHDTSSGVIWGRVHACSLAPEIYSMRTGLWDEEFVRRSSDAGIADFVRIMREGTHTEKEKAVESAWHHAAGD